MTALMVVTYCALYLVDWNLPGLYMDAVNPEYWIPGILDPPAPFYFGVPGNLIADRFPVFTGTVYHGSVQLYAALPFLSVFGTGLGTFRVFQMLVGLGILVLGMRMATRGALGLGVPVAIGAAGLMAVDPALMWGLRTQVYSLHFSLLLLLASVLLMVNWRHSGRPRLRVLCAGMFYGLSVFGYFVFAFFLPGLLWLLVWGSSSDRERPTGPTAALATWVAGAAAGFSPFALGVALMSRELGGVSAALDWIRSSSERLEATGGGAGAVERFSGWATASSRAATGEWPWLMVLQSGYGNAFDALKVVFLIAIPAAVLARPGLGSFVQRRAVATPLVLVVSYMLCSLPLGGRLDGHHFLHLVPLLYVAFGAAAAILVTRRTAAEIADQDFLSHARRHARPTLVVVAAFGILLPSLKNHVEFTTEARATGGVGLYSDAISLFAQNLAKTDPGAVVHTPDWGFAMPVTFLGDPSTTIFGIDVNEINRGVCDGRSQLVVLLGNANRPRFEVVSRLAGRPVTGVATWSQRDGVPVFQVATFGPGDDCGEPIARHSMDDLPPIAPSVTVEAGLPACSFIRPAGVVRIEWSSGASGHATEIHVQAPGQPEVLWTSGPSSGVRASGAWAVPGMIFTLKSARTGDELARTTVREAPCPVE